jgi:hypothetical protein
MSFIVLRSWAPHQKKALGGLDLRVGGSGRYRKFQTPKKASGPYIRCMLIDKDSPMPPRRSSRKDSPAKLAGRMKRRWRVVLLRNKGEILGQVEATDREAAKVAAAAAFDLDEVQRNRIMVHELA